MDKEVECSMAWPQTVTLYRLPDPEKSTFAPWDESSQATLEVVRELALDPEYWKKVKVYFSEENHETVIIQDNVSCIKSICELHVFYP